MENNITEIDFCTLESQCSYLKEKKVRTEFKYILDCDFDLNSTLVEHGYRRFGRYFERPICKDCNECKSLRINAKEFALSKSQRRVIRKNIDTKILISKPILDKEHLDLFYKYHNFMHEKKDWKSYDIDFEQYFDLYVAGHGEFGLEVSYYHDDKLICVDLIDLVKNGFSSIYCYYDPDFSHLSLGKFSLLNQIKMAKELDIEWIYLGYYVKNCPSLEYKIEYKPYEILKEYLPCKEKSVWK